MSTQERPAGYTRETITGCLQECAQDLGRSPSLEEYRRWRDPIQPSVTAIHNTYPSWNAAKQAAGLETTSRGREL